MQKITLNSVEKFNAPYKQHTKTAELKGSEIYRWIGIKDCFDSLAAYQKKDYKECVNFLAIAILKFSTISAAAYGIYRWATRDTVYLSNLLKQAEMDFNNNSNKMSVPPSVVQMTDTSYHEYKKFSKWPTSEKAFFETHLSNSAPTSTAITQHLLTQGIQQKDTSFEKFAISKCLSASISSLSCIAIIDFLTKAPNPESLATAMKISRKCKKDNTFCNKVLETAQTLSTKNRSLDDAKSLVKKMNSKGANQGKGAEFLKDATDLFYEEFQKLEKAIASCQKAKTQSGFWDTATCFSKAQGLDKARIFFGKNDFLDWQEHEAINNRKKALTDYGVYFAQACIKFPESEPCQKFIQHIFQKLVENDMLDEAFDLLIAKGPLQKSEVSTITRIILQKKECDLGKKLAIKALKTNPNHDVQIELATLNTEIQRLEDKAKSALELMKSSNIEETALSEAINNAFLLNDENHLIDIFTTANSWIKNKKILYPKALKLVIQNLFSLERQNDNQFMSSYTYTDKINLPTDMAKILVTRWQEAINAPIFDTRINYDLYRKFGYERSSYSVSITKYNWQDWTR